MTDDLDNKAGGIRGMWTLLRKFLSAEIEYARLTATEKLTILLSALTVGAVFIVIGAMALFYLSVAFIFAIEAFVGGYTWAFIIAACALLLLGIIVYILRYKIIINPISRAVSRLFLENPEAQKQNCYEEE